MSNQNNNEGKPWLLYIALILLFTGFQLETTITSGAQYRSSNMELVGTWPYGPSEDVVVDDSRGLAFISSGATVLVLDVSDPANPSMISSIALPDIAKKMFRSGNILYVADFLEGGLVIIDTSDPLNLFVVGTYDTTGHYLSQSGTLDVFVSDGYAYIADGDRGLVILDVGELTAPTQKGSLEIPGEAQGVFVSGCYAYIACGDEGLRIVDVSDPAYPFEIGFFDSPGSSLNVFVSGGYAVLWQIVWVISINLPCLCWDSIFRTPIFQLAKI